MKYETLPKFQLGYRKAHESPCFSAIPRARLRNVRATRLARALVIEGAMSIARAARKNFRSRAIFRATKPFDGNRAAPPARPRAAIRGSTRSLCNDGRAARDAQCEARVRPQRGEYRRTQAANSGDITTQV